MNLADEVAYRLVLASGFMSEAELDYGSNRWLNCVRNAQLAVENAGKSVLAMFEIPHRTHDPAKSIAAVLRNQDLPDSIEQKIQALLPVLLTLGSTEHFMTDYGDESSRTPPWDLFDKDSATEALEAARASVEGAKEVIAAVEAWRNERNPNQP